MDSSNNIGDRKSAPNEEKKIADVHSKDIRSNVAPVPVETPVWTGPPTHINLPAAAQCGQQHDSHTFRYQSQCQVPQDQLPYPDYLLYQQSQQFNLNSFHTGAEDSSQPSSWFTTEPILCSMMPGEDHTSEPNVCAAFAMDHQYFEEGLSIDNNYLTQPVLYNGNSSGQVLLMNPEPGPVFLTLENAPVHTNDNLYPEKVVATTSHGCSVSPDDSLELFYVQRGPRASNNCRDLIVLGNHNQVGCSPVSRELTVDSHFQAPALQTVTTSRELKSRKPCHCTKSKCLKLYCECFTNGVMCNKCDCSNCHNNIEHEAKRVKAIKSCLFRNPNAFRPKIASGKSGEVKGWHCKGCNCKRSGCLKNYCECYEANIKCTTSCKCVGCRNYDRDPWDRTCEKDKGPPSVITGAVVETVCSCLLARAEEAEKEPQSEAWAQYVILSEFGQCLTHIINAMFKNHSY